MRHIYEKSRYTQNFSRRWVTLWLHKILIALSYWVKNNTRLVCTLLYSSIKPLNSILTKFEVFQLQVWAFTITWLPTVRPAFYESVVITIITVIEEVLFQEFLLWAALVPTQKNTDLSQKWTLFLINTATVMKLF